MTGSKRHNWELSGSKKLSSGFHRNSKQRKLHEIRVPCVLVFFSVLVVSLLMSSAVKVAAQNPSQAGELAARFGKVEPLVDGRASIGTISPSAKVAWSSLTSEAESSGKLLSLRGFSNFLIEKQFQLTGADYANLESLYLSLQRPPSEWASMIESHVASGDAAVPARYDYKVSTSKHPSIMRLQAFHDGKNCSLTSAKLVDHRAIEYSTVATDGSRLMRFNREGDKCEEPIQVPSEMWNADLTQFQSYHEAIRSDDPFLLYFPDAFQSAYNLKGTVDIVSDICGSRIWEQTDTINGKNAFFCGSPLAYMAFDAETGDLLAYVSGEYNLVDRNLKPGSTDRQNLVLFAEHKFFKKLGRLPAETTINIGRAVTLVSLLNAEQASPADSSLVEATIPDNAYVLDRINGVKYIKYGDK